MNDKFFQKSEEEDYELLKDFNQLLKLSKLSVTAEKSSFDASGITNNNVFVAIELKKRNQNLILNDGKYCISGCSTATDKSYIDDTIMIETHKLCSLLLEYIVNNRIPLYINFLNDYIALVFNLSKLNTIPSYKNLKIKSVGYNKIEIGNRLYLNLSNAMIYKKIDGIWKRIVN